MRVHFHGAAGQVTGSMHLVEAAGKRVLLDCGLQQGSQELEAANADPFPFDAASIDALVLSHAHIDHIGRVPLLVRRGFRGPIWTQRATADLVPIIYGVLALIGAAVTAAYAGFKWLFGRLA